MTILMFLFSILVISCCVVAASLIAEKTNVGVSVFIADITSMCDFGSDGAAALLSVCSFVRCCSHQFVFSCLDEISCLKLKNASKVEKNALELNIARTRYSYRSANNSPPLMRFIFYVLS